MSEEKERICPITDETCYYEYECGVCDIFIRFQEAKKSDEKRGWFKEMTEQGTIDMLEALIEEDKQRIAADKHFENVHRIPTEEAHVSFYSNCLAAFRQLKQYQEIGTIEECRKAMKIMKEV